MPNPDIDIHAAALDERLNEHGYILPGLEMLEIVYSEPNNKFYIVNAFATDYCHIKSDNNHRTERKDSKYRLLSFLAYCGVKGGK